MCQGPAPRPAVAAGPRDRGRGPGRGLRTPGAAPGRGPAPAARAAEADRIGGLGRRGDAPGPRLDDPQGHALRPRTWTVTGSTWRIWTATPASETSRSAS